MAQENIIVNGTFDEGSKGWSGTDLETNYTENAYLHNGSKNNVAELDGTKSAVTVMEQTVKIDHALDTTLTFRTALRTEVLGSAGKEGYLVEIVDEKGNVISKQEVFPKSAEWTDHAVKVSFPDGGTYTVRFSELGPNDSYGAIIDDVQMLVCFVAGTMIKTAGGVKPVEALEVGDLVWTLDAGWQPLRWIGKRVVTQGQMEAMPQLRPVYFDRGALGPDQPRQRMGLSPQHRVLRQGWLAELHFGQPEVLAPAVAFVNGRDDPAGAAGGGCDLCAFPAGRASDCRLGRGVDGKLFPDGDGPWRG